MNYEEYKQGFEIANQVLQYLKSGKNMFVLHWRTDEPKQRRGVERAEIVSESDVHLMDVPLEIVTLLMFLTQSIAKMQGDEERRVLFKPFLAMLGEDRSGTK